MRIRVVTSGGFGGLTLYYGMEQASPQVQGLAQRLETKVRTKQAKPAVAGRADTSASPSEGQTHRSAPTHSSKTTQSLPTSQPSIPKATVLESAATQATPSTPSTSPPNQTPKASAPPVAPATPNKTQENEPTPRKSNKETPSAAAPSQEPLAALELPDGAAYALEIHSQGTTRRYTLHDQEEPAVLELLDALLAQLPILDQE